MSKTYTTEVYEFGTDNDYCHSWTDEEKLEAFVSFDNEDLMDF